MALKSDYLKTVLVLICSKLLSLLKLSSVVGSHGILFSASNLCLPLVGLFGRTSGATVTWALLLGLRLMAGAFSVATLAFYLPGYAAALYLATPNRLLRFGIPAFCMVLFLLHPVGFQAAIYSFYWIIPMLVGTGLFRSFYVTALGATFTAHAVGSVIWLYTVPMAAEEWLALIPLVAIERITFAAGMVALYYGITMLSNLASRAAQYGASVITVAR